MDIIITSPSLDPTQNVSGISSVTKFIISNNKSYKYTHFELGKKDRERGGAIRFFSLLRSFMKWWLLIRRSKEMIVHYNFPLSTASILRDPLFMGLALLYKRKIVVHIHGGNFLSNYSSAPAYCKWILRKVFKWDVPFIVLGEKEKEILTMNFGISRVLVLPNCVDLDVAKAFSKTYSKDKPLVIGYLGRIAESKGISYLLQACQTMKDKDIPFMLHLAGTEEVVDSFIPEFREKLGDRFVYWGVVYDTTKIAFLKGLDVFVIPSFFEGLPMSLLECMSYGVVPVVTDVGSMGDVVKDGVNGLMVKVRNSESIEKAITRLDGSRDLLARLGHQAKADIFDYYNPKKYVERLISIYQSV